MNSRFSPRAVLVGLAVGVLLALVLAPQSRWLVNYQLYAVGFSFQPSSVNTPQAQGMAARVATSHPNDYALQWAAATETGNRAQRVAALRALTTRFGDKPSLYAALLRNETSSSVSEGVYLFRLEESELSVNPQAAGRIKIKASPLPAALAAFDADAARGELLDPDNAYFPLMRAIGLFAAHRDVEGLAAVQRASIKPMWNEYLSEEVNARLRIAEVAYGHGISISHVAIAASELYPEYGPLRAVARLVVVLAIHTEQGGDPARGMSIRRALIQCGDLMRVQGTNYICNLVGVAISTIALARPGGGLQTRPQNMDNLDWARVRLMTFAQYAQRAGFPADAARAEAEYAANEAMRNLFKRAENKSLFGPRRFLPLAAAWGGSLLILVNVLWLLTLGMLAALLCRLPSVKNRQPLPPAARWGMLAACAVAISAAAFAFADYETRIFIVLVLMLIAAGGLGLGALAARREGARQWGATFAKTLAVTVAAFGCIGLVAGWQMHGMLAFVQVGTETTGLSGGGNGEDSGASTAMGLLVGAGLLVPLILAIVLSIRARVRREPVSGALPQGFRAVAVPVACILLIAYGPLLLGTLRQERQIDSELSQMIRHEGRYYAALAGARWPGPA